MRRDVTTSRDLGDNFVLEWERINAEPGIDRLTLTLYFRTMARGVDDLMPIISCGALIPIDIESMDFDALERHMTDSIANRLRLLADSVKEEA